MIMRVKNNKRSLGDRERFLEMYSPAAKRFGKLTARRSGSSSRKNAYDLLFVGLRRLNFQFSCNCRTFFGDSMRVLLPEYGSCTVWETGIVDLQTPMYLAAALPKGGVCFDGGANFGFYSLLALALVGQSGSVHSFEPAAVAFAFLEKNLRCFENARLVQAAVSDSDGSCRFTDLSVIAGGFNRVDSAGVEASKGQSIQVRCLRLDTYCDQAGIAPDVIKLDVEGHELAALRGLERTIAEAQPCIIVEYGMAEGDNLGASRFLLDRGYRSLVAGSCKLNACSLDHIAASAPGENYLFVPPDRLKAMASWIA